MTGEDELRVHAPLLKALGLSPEDGAAADPAAVLAACLRALAPELGLAERDDPSFSWVAHAGIPPRPMKVLSHYFTGTPDSELDDEQLRRGIYDALVHLSKDSAALKSLDKNRSMMAEDFLTFAQIFWNIDAQGQRTRLPIRYGQKLSNGAPARLKVPGADEDFATLVLSQRAGQTPGYSSAAGAFYERGARVSVLVARHVVDDAEGPNGDGATFRSTPTDRGTEWWIVWPRLEADTDRTGVEAGVAGSLPPRKPERLDLESAVVEAAEHLNALPDLRVVVPRPEPHDAHRFLSGASLTSADVGKFAIPRRVTFDGDVYYVDDLATRITAEDTIGYLIAGAGEGKSTYLHTLSSSLAPRAIVFRWRVTGQLDWAGLQQFRDRFVPRDDSGETRQTPIVILGELATRPTREQEDALVETAQSIPAGMAPAGTSLVLAGRPAWLTRIRLGLSTGHTMRLMPLVESEAALLIENLGRAHRACQEERGPGWTHARFPNLGRFLSMPRKSQVALFVQGHSLVGSLLHAAYGHEFTRRLISEYADLDPAERAAYLLVSLGTTTLGGVSDELLDLITPDADVDRCSSGSPWQRDPDGVHRARHETMGRVVVEDKGASTAREISQLFGRILEAAPSSSEARSLLLRSVRIFDEPQSLVPEQRRKTEPQFRTAVRAGVLAHRDSWERLEQSIDLRDADFLHLAHTMYRLLPEKMGGGEKNAYLLARLEHLLRAAEIAAPPGSSLASEARYRRVIAGRYARRNRGDVVDDPDDLRVLLPMLRQPWPDAQFYAQFVWVGLSTLRECQLGEDEWDQMAEAVLEAWQRLRSEGDSRELVYTYSTFVARDLYELPVGRRITLWETAWEFSRAIDNPDGALACLLDDDLIKLQRTRTGRAAHDVRERRRRILSASVVPEQANAEVLLRFAQITGTDDAAARHLVLQAVRPLATHETSTSRSMALHALALVTDEPTERVNLLRDALSAYEDSMVSRDDWLTRGSHWKHALRLLRQISPDEASTLDRQIAAAGRKFSM